jgi:hypothetical protein
LVLVKLILESIPIYWLSIHHIPKGILDKIKRKCFKFLWSSKILEEGIPLVKCTRIAKPKELGGWGLKNVHAFSHALAKKISWRLFFNKRLWGKVMKAKYLDNKGPEDWIRQEKVF